MLTLVVAPPGARPPALNGRLANVWRDDGGAVFARAFVKDETRLLIWSGLGVFRFTPESPAVTVWPESPETVDTVRDMFARVVQPLVLQAQGWQAMHASAVAGAAGALAFCGDGHSGKSTLAFVAGQQQGLTQIADDAIVLGVTTSDVMLEPIAFRAKLRRAAYEHLRQRTATDPHGQAAFAPSRRLPLLAIVVLSQSADAPSRAITIRLRGAEAFRELLRHAHCFDDYDRVHNRAVLDSYLTVAATVPIYRVTYRPDLNAVDDLAADVVALGFGPGVDSGAGLATDRQT